MNLDYEISVLLDDGEFTGDLTTFPELYNKDNLWIEISLIGKNDNISFNIPIIFLSRDRIYDDKYEFLIGKRDKCAHCPNCDVYNEIIKIGEDFKISLFAEDHGSVSIPRVTILVPCEKIRKEITDVTTKLKERFPSKFIC